MAAQFESGDPQFDEALGVYVGPASYDEVVKALSGEMAVRVEPAKGEVAWHHGWCEHYKVVDENRLLDLFVISEHQEALGVGVMHPNAFVFWLQRLTPDRRLDADLYSGGVDLRLGFDTRITVAIWHSVQHVTETGDVAPGLGPFTARLEEEGEE
jgi:hypothetical protein